MMKSIIPDARQPKSHELHPRSKSTKKISDILKHTNELIREGNLDGAQGELRQANRAAKEEFIKEISSQSEKEKVIATNSQPNQLPLPPIEALINTISASEKKPNPLPWKTTPPAKNKPENPMEKLPKSKNIEFTYYRTALAKAWHDGALTSDEKRQLEELREVLERTDFEHEILEKEVKMSCYQNAISQFLSGGSAKISYAKSLSEINDAFHISKDQLSNAKEPESHESILLIDDDTSFLGLTENSLRAAGFDVTAVTTSDEAFTHLQEYIPDIILCDIYLKTSTMDGFTFYQKIQSIKYLQQVPFVFLTGLADENLAKTGRELGADDYLMKPISSGALVSALRGRIKRAKQLRYYYEAETSRGH
jgi:CheY-like chemotaxis protein